MKKLVLTAIISATIGFFAFPLAADLSQLHGGWHSFFVLPGYGTTQAFEKNCTKDISRNGHGWVFVNREFFGCGKVNIAISDLIYGEYSRPQTDKERKALEAFEKKRTLDVDED